VRPLPIPIENITAKSTLKNDVLVTAKGVKIETVKSYRYRPGERNIHRLTAVDREVMQRALASAHD
jgi:hypothetical protein